LDYQRLANPAMVLSVLPALAVNLSMPGNKKIKSKREYVFTSKEMQPAGNPPTYD